MALQRRLMAWSSMVATADGSQGWTYYLCCALLISLEWRLNTPGVWKALVDGVQSLCLVTNMQTAREGAVYPMST